jgi:ABC-type phosphate transport system substrate-binding protein
VALSPAARPAEAAIQACAHALPGLALTIDEVSDPGLDLDTFDINLGLGIRDPSLGFLAPIGSEQIVIIVQKDIPITSLSIGDIRALFDGDVGSWGELIGPQASFNTVVIVYGYAPSDPLRQVFETAVLGSSASFSPGLFLAPDPKAMLGAVADTPGAIGYLPKAWLDNRVTSISLPAGIAKTLTLPLLVAAADTPSAAATELVRCLQDSTGQNALTDLYLPYQE